MFFEMLHHSEMQESKPKKSAILSVIEGHSHRYTPKVMQLDLPTPLSAIYSSTWLEMDLPMLLVESAKVFDNLQVTQQQCLVVEEETREQSKSKVWFDQRAGRVTGSVFYEAAKANRAVSLIKRICYPRSSQFSTEATRWGQVNEERARANYISMMQDQHGDFQVYQQVINICTAHQYLFTVYLYTLYTFQFKASGFVINPDLPWIGATPDGQVTCTCHGEGVLEIKCPFNSRDRSLNESCRDSSFCLGIGEDGTMALKTDHKFMYQVQAQMHVSTVSYCDFIVWTPQEFFIQRIMYDPVFFHNAYLKVVEFIKTGVLPELLGKWYTAPRHTHPNTTTTEQPSEMGCYCGKPRDTDDITCTSGQCKRKHFHKSCLKLSRVPKTWKCVECRRKRVVLA
ncbi:uncharacterized protein LOC143715422 isoform X2 [Siphateles boraxobius]|uniref:uncharacterized protein LOC143715422 isoform X2 n=1 Tax=Siphateles boraxobius TaxID=180520 RepID=UPI00406479BE